MRLLIILLFLLGLLSNCQRDSSTIDPSSNPIPVGDWQLTKLVGGFSGGTFTPQEPSMFRFTTAGTYTRFISGVTRETGRYEYTPIDNPKPGEKQATITLSNIVYYTSSGQQSSTGVRPVQLLVMTQTANELNFYQDGIADGYLEYYVRAK